MLLYSYSGVSFLDFFPFLFQIFVILQFCYFRMIGICPSPMVEITKKQLLRNFEGSGSS